MPCICHAQLSVQPDVLQGRSTNSVRLTAASRLCLSASFRQLTSLVSPACRTAAVIVGWQLWCEGHRVLPVC